VPKKNKIPYGPGDFVQPSKSIKKNMKERGEEKAGKADVIRGKKGTSAL